MPDDAVITGIKRDIAAYEAERVAARRSAMLRVPLYVGGLIAVVVALALALNLVADVNEQWLSTLHVYLYVVAVIVALFLYFLALRPLEAASASFRDKLLPIIFGFIKDMRHEREVMQPSFAALPDATVGKFNLMEFDDSISGTYEDFRFELYETLLIQRNDKYDTTTFQGVIVAFKLENPFPGMLIATVRTNAVLSFFSEIFGSALVEVRSGVEELDAAYDFRSNNAKAAQPIVSGQMAQALTWLKDAWPGEPARIAFKGKDGFLLLPDKRNFFELPAPNVPLDYKAHVEPMIADMATMLAITALVRKIGT